MSTPSSSAFVISHHKSLLENLITFGAHLGVALLGSHLVTRELNYNTDSATRKMFALANFHAFMALPFVSLAIETGHPAYLGLAVLSMGHVFWAARHIYSYFQETRPGDVQTGIKKAMRVMASGLALPVICYSWHVYSSLGTKV